VIQPKNKEAAAAPMRPAAAIAPPLKGAENIATPRQETQQ
jgi:hypothetical protein